MQAADEAGPVPLAATGENAPNSLPQILHLSYKNHGLFVLDLIRYQLGQRAGAALRAALRRPDGPMYYFAEALDKDDTDQELWCRASAVAASAGSGRIARFCLEAVLDEDEEGLESILQLPGVQGSLAGQQLRQLVEALQDQLSLLQAPLSSIRRKKLSAALKRRLLPFEPDIDGYHFTALDKSELSGRNAERIPIASSRSDWAAVGDAILQLHFCEQAKQVDPSPGSAISLLLPHALTNGSLTAHAGVDGSLSRQHSDDESMVTAPEPHEEQPEPVGETKAVGPHSADPPVAPLQEGAEGSQPAAAGVSQGERAETPSRKRSTDSAGLPETADGGRGRSKRLRARESIHEGGTGPDAAALDLSKQMQTELWNFEQADHFLFAINNDLLGRININGMGTAKELRDLTASAVNDTPTEAPGTLNKAIEDLYSTIRTCPQAVALLLGGDGIDDLGKQSRETGLNAFLGLTKGSNSRTNAKPSMLDNIGLERWTRKVNGDWLSLKQVAWSWLEAMLRPGHLSPRSSRAHEDKSSYVQYQWSDELKRILVQIIVNLDVYIFDRLHAAIIDIDHKVLAAKCASTVCGMSSEDLSLIEMAQTLFELHLDVYSLIKHPNSGVDAMTQTLQKDRLERWSALARDGLNLRSSGTGDYKLDDLALRHIWASTFHISVCDELLPEHVVDCMEDLKAVFEACKDRTIRLHNNAVMPELSADAVDRELARMRMKDFVMKVFDHDEQDPVAVIENLEPILEPASIDHALSVGAGEANGDHKAADSDALQEGAVALSMASPIREMTKFIDGASVLVRLSLWQRLRQAYENIDYPPKVISCYLRSIETLMKELKSQAYEENSGDQRELVLLRYMRMIDEFVSRILVVAKSSSQAWECIDEHHLRSSLTAVAEYTRLACTTNVFEDQWRVNLIPPPNLEGRPNPAFLPVLDRLHDMFIRAWILQYQLLSEAMVQQPEAFPTAADDKFEYLRHVHYATGIRKYCHAANRVLLRLLRDDFLDMSGLSDPDSRDSELCQVLHDLYGLRLSSDSNIMDYGCEPEPLEKRNAVQLLPFVMSQTKKINLKDLPKTEVKATIDKVHGALGRPKATEAMQANGKLLRAHLKSPVNPLDLYQCLEGIGFLPALHVPSAKGIMPAVKGWYFLMGNIALNKYRSQKRVAPGPIEDINIAAAFLMQDLEYNMERWETWYRLAQTHDSQLEDAVAWTAEKLNSNSHEVLTYQRNAVHCYTMAVACAERLEEVDTETSNKIGNLYFDFGMRIYASSRPPFSMGAFAFKEDEIRHFSGQTMYTNQPFQPMQSYPAWKFAAALFKRAISRKPGYWMSHYMLAKCLWKMHTMLGVERGRDLPPAASRVIHAVQQAIDNLPDKKDSRKEPIIEPHYKLLSVVHKLVLRRELTPEAASEALQSTHYASKVPTVKEMDDWEPYVLQILKALRNADKSGWHHRLTARAAHVIYDDSANDPMAAMGAKHELTQQMFTKTMQIQVWKPEYERPGRHFVYTTRYTQFFVRLLIQLKDRVNLEALAKRLRKKPHDYIAHTKLWTEVCTSYLGLLRRTGRIPEGQEEVVFKSLNHDEFTIRSARIEAWCHAPDTQSIVLDVLKEAIELKKLNNSLMRSLTIDDLIGDTYATIYAEIGPTLPPLPSESAPPVQPSPAPPVQPVDNFVRTNAMSLNSMMNVDGANDQPQAVPMMTPSHSQQPTEPVPRPRVKPIGRREIQRKAEAAVTKPAAAPPPPTPNHLTSMSFSESTLHALKGTGPYVMTPSTGQQQPAGAVETSAPISVHDSADESDLSDPDPDVEAEQEEDHEQEQEERKPLFPNLARQVIELTDSSAVPSGAQTPEPPELQQDGGQAGGNDVKMEEG